MEVLSELVGDLVVGGGDHVNVITSLTSARLTSVRPFALFPRSLFVHSTLYFIVLLLFDF